jgi:hypothetical protein
MSEGSKYDRDSASDCMVGGEGHATQLDLLDSCDGSVNDDLFFRRTGHFQRAQTKQEVVEFGQVDQEGS